MHIKQSLLGNDDFSDEFFHLKNFENLLYDACYMLYHAHDVDAENDADGYEFTLIRGSMFNSLLLFECAANCCIDSLKLRGRYFSDIDKLPFLSKFEFFLDRISPGSMFDRGSRIAQSVAELKSLRDGYVHPKVKKKQYRNEGTGLNVVEFEKTEILKISHDPSQWGRSTAISAFRTAHDFFNVFFLDWCGFSPDTVCSILIHSGAAEIPCSASTYVDSIGGLDRAMREWGLDFKFLGKSS